MAGIGFSLKKLFVGRSVAAKLRAYAYTSVVTSGTMALAVVLMIGVQMITKMFGATDLETSTMVVLMVYAMLGSLVVSSLLQLLLSRYAADMIYQKQNSKVLPSLYGGALTLMIPGGVVYGLFLRGAQDITLLDKALNLGLFIILMMVWLQMAYISAARDYKKILFGFAAGVGVVFGLGAVLLAVGMSPITAMMLSLFCGYGVMFVSFSHVLLTIFPAGSGSLFAFVVWLAKYPGLVLIGLLGMCGAFVHIVVMWFSPLGEVVAGCFRYAPLHDSAAFFAYLVAIPANINFVVSVEVNFFEKYKAYFSAISNGGTLSEIKRARETMKKVLKQELFRLTETQAFVMILYMALMRYGLEALGFTRDMIDMFQVMVIGYSAYALGNCLMLLHLYFNDRRGAMTSCVLFFSLNLAGALLTYNKDPVFYGVGMAVAGIVMYLFGLLRLMAYVKKIDCHVFCSQPILADTRTHRLAKFAAWLDARASVRDTAPMRATGKGELYQ